MRNFLIFLVLSCSKIERIPQLNVSPNPSQINSYANIIYNIPDSIKSEDIYLVIHQIFRNSENSEIIRIDKSKKIIQLFIPESLVNYSIYLIADTFTVGIEGIRIYEKTKPVRNTNFISAIYYTNDKSKKLELLKNEMLNYPENLKAKAYYDCLRGEKTSNNDIYLIYYEICKHYNEENILKALLIGDSSYNYLKFLSKRNLNILEISSKKFLYDMELQMRKMEVLNSQGRYEEALQLSEFIINHLNLEWLYKSYPSLNYKERNKIFFKNFSHVYEQRAIAFLHLNDTLNYKNSLEIYCLNYPNPFEVLNKCKNLKKFITKIKPK